MLHVKQTMILVMAKRKFTNEQVIEAYKKTNNIWKCGDLIGLSGQHVHRILRESNFQTKRKNFTEEEKQKIRDFYLSSMSVRKVDNLRSFSRLLGRRHTNVCREAQKMGLTSYNRTIGDELKSIQGARIKELWKTKGHPRGALGMKHSLETRKVIGAKSSLAWHNMSLQNRANRNLRMLKTKSERGTLRVERKASWKASWQEFNGKRMFMRSSWEVNYAHILEKRKALKIITSWEYEPETFWFEKIKTGVRCYTPDFKVLWPDGGIEYHEVKGWMDAASATKLKRMRIYHPKVKIVLVDTKHYKAVMARGI